MAFQSKDPLGLELDVELHVSENELMAIDDDLRPTFVNGITKYLTHISRKQHWKPNPNRR